MNRIFRIIWSVALGAWVVVSELAMSPRHARRGRAGRTCAASLLAIACSTVHAEDLAFDGNGPWDTTRLAWFDGSAWRAWDNLAPARAVFAAPGTVTLAESIVAGGLAFDAAGSHLLTGSGALALDGARTIALAHGAQATIAVPLTGGFTVSSAGSGTLQIDRDNAATYAGIARVGSGATLVLGHRHALGTSTDASALVLEDGARLDFGVGGTFDLDLTLAGGRMRVVPRVVNGTWRGVPVPAGASELVFGAGTNTAQTWTGALRDNGAHVLALAVEASDGFGPTLTGANTYGGATTLHSGMLHVANAIALSPNTHVVFAGRDDAYATMSFGWSGPLNATLGDGAGQWRWTGSGGFRNTTGTTTVTFDDGARLAWGAGGFVPDGAALEVGRGITFTNPIALGDALRDVFGGGTLRGALDGDGGLRLRAGTLVLAAANDWRGETHVASRNNLVFGAQLQLNHANALPDASPLVLDDGLLVLGQNGGDFLRGIGAGAGQVRFAGSGGFGSASGVRSVDLGGDGATLRWNAPGFLVDGATLAFAGATAGASVLFRNGLDLDGAERRIDLAATAAPDNVPHRAVTLAGVIDNGALTVSGFGEAFVTADNTYTGRTVIGATEITTRLRVASLADGGIASGLGASSNAATNLVFGSRGSYYGVLVHAGEAASTDRGFTMNGNAELVAEGTGPLTWTGAPVVANATTTDLRLGGAGVGHFAGTLADGSAALSLTKHGAGTWRLSGDNTFTGAVRIGGNSFGVAGSGVLEVSSIGHAHQAGNLGINAANTAANLSMFNRAVLRYLGAGEVTNRNLLRGAQSTGGLNDRTGGIAIESSGTGALAWTGTIQMHHASNAWLRLGGTNEDDNVLASALHNASQAISLAKDGSGLWALSGTNTYTGATDIVDGVLRIDAAHALAGGLGATDAAGSGVRLSGGLLGLTGDFARALGNTAGRNNIAWQGSGGFAAYGGTRTVDLGGAGATMAWGATAFVGDGASLRLGHRTSDGTLVFRNGIDFANGERTIEVGDGTHAIDAHLEGTLRGHGGFAKTGGGTLRITGDNTYTGRSWLRDGVVEIARMRNLGDAALVIDGATLRHIGDADQDARDLVVGAGGATLDASGNGTWRLDGTIAADGAISLGGTATGHLGGGLDGASLQKRDAGTWILSGDSAPVAIDIVEGTLQLGDDGTTGSVGDATIANAGTLALARADRAEFANVIDGPGTILQAGGGTSVLTATGSRAGRLQVDRGTLALAGTMDAADVALGNGTLHVTGRLDAVDLAGIAGTDSVLRIDGGGRLAANGDLGDGDDAVVLDETATRIGWIDGGTGTDRVMLETEGTFAFEGTGLAGFERLHKRGAGIAMLVSDATWDAVAVEEGTLRVDAHLDAGVATVSDGATLAIAGTARTQVAGDAGLNTVRIAAGGLLEATGALGGGADLLDVAGTLDTGDGVFGLGDGDDVFVVHDGARVVGTIDGGAGFDSRVYAIDGRAEIGALQGFEGIEKRGVGVLAMTGPASTSLAEVAVLGGTLHVTSAGTIADVVLTDIGAGAQLQVDGAFLGSSGDDVFTLQGTVTGTGRVELAAGDDRLIVRDGARFDADVLGGAGRDTVELDGTLVFDGGRVLDFEVLRKTGDGIARLEEAATRNWLAAHVDAGALAIGATHTLHADAIHVADEAMLQIAGVAEGRTIGDDGDNHLRIDATGTLHADGDFGAGVDTLDIAGTLDTRGGTFALGDGDDHFLVRDGARVEGIVDGGAGLDTRIYDIAGDATLGAMVNFEGVSKRGIGTLRIAGPATTPLQAVEVLGGRLVVGADASVAGVRETHVAATLQVDGQFTGSGDADTMTVDGTLSGTGVVDLQGGDDTLVLRDGADLAGLSRALSGGAGDDLLTVDIAGDATLGGIAAFERLHKQGDGILRVLGAAPSDLVSTHVDGGTLAIGVDGSIRDVRDTRVASGATLRVDGLLRGSAGADAATIAGLVSGSGTFDLGDGDDMLTLRDGAALAMRIDGGADRDALVLDSLATLMFDQGTAIGFEALHKTGAGLAHLQGDGHFDDGVRIDAGALVIDAGHRLRAPSFALGADTTLQVAGIAEGAVEGDTGAHVVRVDAGGVLRGIGDLGDGNDTLDIAGALDTGDGAFALGDGDDLFIVHDGTRVSGVVDGGAGDDTRRYDIDGVARLGALWNFEGLEKHGAGTLHVDGPAATPLARVDVAEGTLHIGASGAIVDVVDGRVAAGATLRVDGQLRGSIGDDTLTLAGTVEGAGTVALGAGRDTLVLRDGAVPTIAIDGGADPDAIVLDTDRGLTFNADNAVGFEALRKQGTGTATLAGAASAYDTVAVEAGRLAIAAPHALRTAQVALADAAILHVDGRVDADRIAGSTGTDTLRIGATGHVAATGDLGDGNDVLDVAGTLDTRDGVFHLGAGDDILVVHDSTRIVGTLDAGEGNDRLTVDVRAGGDVAMGSTSGFESLGKAGQGTLSFDGDAAFIDVVVDAGRLAIATDAAVSAHGTTLGTGAWLDIAGTFGGTADDDAFDVAGRVTGHGGIDLGAGDDTLTLRDGADLSGLATAVDGGAGDDRLEVRIAGDATLGGATGFETLAKRDVGLLRILGPATSRFTRIDVDGGTLALGTQGSVDGVQSVHVAAGAVVDNAGGVRFTDGADSARIDGTWSGTGTFDFAAGDDALVATGAWTGDITLGAGNDTVTFAGATLGAAHIDGGAGEDDHVAFLGMALDAGALPTFDGIERVRLLDASHAAIVDVLDLGAGTLEIDGSSSAYIAHAARLRGHVDSAGFVRTGDARLAIEGDYTGRDGAHLSVSVSPANGIAGGLDIAGDVRGETGVVFASDGTQGFAPATILVVSAPADRAGEGGFHAAETLDGTVRLDGSPFAWSFEHDAAHDGWVLRTGDHAPLVPELPGYGALPTIAASATDDTHRILRERMSALRGDARTCTPQGHATIAGDCRGAWMAVFDGALDLGANPGVAVRGDLRGMLAGTDRLFPAGDDPASAATFRAGLFGGLLQGDHVTSGANSSPHAGVGAARLRSTTPVLGFHAGATTDAGRYLDAQLIAQRTVARVHATGGFEDTQRGTGLSLRAQAGMRHAVGDWRIEPQVELGVAAQAWRDRFDAGGRDVVLADDTTGHARVALRVERPFAPASGTVRPWASVALTDVRGEATDALHLRAPTGEVFRLPNHARGLGASLDVGLDASLADGLHLSATISAAESLQGTSSSARQATLGLRWRW